MAQKGFTLWLTGPPGSGKTTLARLAETELKGRGLRVEVVDKDSLTADETTARGAEKGGDDGHARRIAAVCEALTAEGVIAVAAAAVPTVRAGRGETGGDASPLVEVYVKRAPDERSKHPAEAPYEEPLSPELVIEAGAETPQQSCARIINRLGELNLIAPAVSESAGYDEDDEEIIRRRLEELGYM